VGSLKSASLNDILKEQLIVVLKFCLCIIVSPFDLLQLPQTFGERSFSANISPQPFIVSNTDGTYTVVADTSASVNRHHGSSGDCLEGKRENYQVCSVQYCVQQLCTVRCTHI